jgi:LEA14-like dessication related protein
MKLGTLLFLLIFVTSCISFKEPELKGFNGYEIGKLAGSEVMVTLKPIVYNPNFYAIKVKKSSLVLAIERQPFGNVHLDKPIKVKAKKTSEILLPLRIELEKGAVMKLMSLALKDSINLKLSGEIKGGVYFMTKKFPIEVERKISPKMLNPFNRP